MKLEPVASCEGDTSAFLVAAPPSSSPYACANWAFVLGLVASYKRVKGKVKFTLEQATKTQTGEQSYSSTLSLTLALDRGGWSTPRPGRFSPGKDPVPIV